MKTKPITYMAIILDSSGSMAPTKNQSIQGFNELIQQAKINAKDQDIKVCLVTFSGDVFEHLWLENVETLQEANADDYCPNGSTAMRDAVGYTIRKLMDTTNPNDENVAYLVHVISDGAENASKHYSISALREIVESTKAKGNFTIAYMGCSENYLKEVAVQTGIPMANMAAWSNASGGATARGWSGSNTRAGKFYKMRSAGIVASDNYYSDQVGCCADFSKEPDVGAPAPTPGLPTFVPVPVPTTPPADVVPQNIIILNDGHSTVCAGNVNCFANRTPVSWNGYQS